jgi:hypothetical protein
MHLEAAMMRAVSTARRLASQLSLVSRPVSLTLLGVLLCVLAAGPVPASNMGFKLEYPLVGEGRANFISLPYRYWPDGDLSNFDQDTEDICYDFETHATDPCVPTVVGQLVRVGPSRFAVRNHICHTTLGLWSVYAGEAIYVLTAEDCSADIVGSHDDTYSAGRGSSTIALLEGTNPVSVPYHLQAETAEELCQDFNSRYPPHGLGLVTRFHAQMGTAQTHPCGTAIGNFTLRRGEALFLTPVLSGGATQLDVQWTTY